MRALRASTGRVEPAREPFLHPAAPRARARRRASAPAGSASCTRGRGARGTSSGVAGFELDFGVLAAAATPCRATRTSRRSRPSARTSRSWSPTTCRPRACVEVVRDAGGALLRARRGVRRLPRRAGRRGPRVARRAAGVPRARPHADRRGGRPAAREDRRRAARRGRGRAAWPSVAVLGASGYAGAIAAMLVHRHPFFELAHVTARSEAGERLDDLHPRTRVPLELEAWDPDAQGDVDAALVCWPHGASPRPRWPRCASAASASSTCPPTSACATAEVYEDWYGEHGAPGAVRPGRLRPARAAPRGDRRRRPRRQPRLLPDRRAARARAARARRADRRRRRRREVRRLGRRPRADGDDALHLRRRERHALQGRAPPPHAGDRAGAGRPGRAVTDHVHAAPRAARPGRARVLLRHARARARRGRARRALRRRLRARAVGRAARSGRPACSTCATRTTAASRSTATRAPAGPRVLGAIDNLWKGAASQAVQNLNLMFGRDEARGCE